MNLVKIRNHPFTGKGGVILLSLVFIIAGGLWYVLFRPGKPLFFDWLYTIGLKNRIETIREFTLHARSIFPDWVLYSLPSSLWAFAYSILITGIWWRNKSWIKYFWFATILLLVVGWEILQLTGLIRGTFSFGDIIAGLLGAAAGVFVGIKLTKPKYHEKKPVE